MRVTVVGCGDAFGSGGRGNTCFWIETEGITLALDFGASALVALKRLGLAVTQLDAVMISHLHGDHFGGLPFLLLDCQFALGRERPLTIIGPEGTRDRLGRALEVFFPGSSQMTWRFPLEIVELPCGAPQTIGPLSIRTAPVEHPSGSPSTAVRIAQDGGPTLAYSGDTHWTETLVDIAEGADLFILECYRFAAPVPYHLDFSTVEAHKPWLKARRIMLTHMSEEMLSQLETVEAKGYLAAHDGLVLEL